MKNRAKSKRAGISRTIFVVALVLTILTVAGSWALWSAYRQGRYEERIAQARGHLQLAKNEDSLQALSIPDDGDAPAEYHYLKSLTLERMGRGEPALAAIRRALESAPGHPRYKAFELKLRLLARERASVDQLIELNRQFGSVANVALFATYGYQAKELLLEDDRKPQAAEFHRKRKLETLSTALTLSAEIPELHPELLNFAVRNGRHEEALRLIDQLLLLDPASVGLRGQKVSVLLQLKRPDDAAALARKLFVESREGRTEAEFYAAVLAQGSGTEAHDRQFEELVEKFPISIPILSKQALYLTRTGRLTEAEKGLAAAIERQTLKENREALAFVAVSLPLEVGAPEVADEQLRICRRHLRDPLMADYFEARILYLRKDYSEAIRRMLKIAQAAERGGLDSKLMATEALKWVRAMLADKVIAEQMTSVLKATAQSEANAPAVRVEGTEDKPEAPQNPAQQPDS